MKQFIVFAALLVALTGCTSGTGLLRGSSSIDNNTAYASHTATSTASYCSTCPVLLADNDPGRRWMEITNTGNNGNTVYLYLSGTDLELNLTELGTGETSATSTIDNINELIMLRPSTTYKILPENLFTGEIWATSTAPASPTIITVVNGYN